MSYISINRLSLGNFYGRAIKTTFTKFEIRIRDSNKLIR